MNRLELRIMNKQNMDKRNYAFDRTNFTLLAIGFAIVVIGFILMSGSSSTEQAFNPDIFSFRRIKVAPVSTSQRTRVPRLHLPKHHLTTRRPDDTDTDYYHRYRGGTH